jgi:hypothetical protein
LYTDKFRSLLGENRQKAGGIESRRDDNPDGFAGFKVGNIHHRIPGKRLGGRIVTAFRQFSAYTDRSRSFPN